MKPLALALPVVLLLSSCAAYRAQHGGTPAATAAKSERTAAVADHSAHGAEPAAAPARRTSSASIDKALVPALATATPFGERQAMLLSEIDKYQDELKANGMYDCCVKPACKQCALTAGECHCREVISANGPCCGECTQAWVEGRGDAPGVDREKVLAHLGCVRELYEKKTPEGMVPPGQRKDGKKQE